MFFVLKMSSDFYISALQTKILVIVVSLSAHFSFLYFHCIEIAAKSLVKVVVKEVAAEKNDNITLIFFSYFLSKKYVVGSQKNRLNEIFLSTQNIYFN